MRDSSRHPCERGASPHGDRRQSAECVQRYLAGEDALELSRALDIPPSRLMRIVLEARGARPSPEPVKHPRTALARRLHRRNC